MFNLTSYPSGEDRSNRESNISSVPFSSIFWVNAGMNVGMEKNQIYGTRCNYYKRSIESYF